MEISYEPPFIPKIGYIINTPTDIWGLTVKSDEFILRAK